MDRTSTDRNLGDMEIFYNERTIKISELTDEEKTQCISQLWLQKEAIEGEKEILQEMIQKMYFYGKMEHIQEKND